MPGLWDSIASHLPNAKADRTSLSFPTELCILCRPRTPKGLLPACVQQGMAGCMPYGRIEDLAKPMKKNHRMVLWAPK